MQDPFLRLKDRAEVLGSHNRKYIRTIANHKDALIERLEAGGRIDRVHFWRKAPSYSEEMATIAEVGRTLEERLCFLACYYALQFLHMNIRAIDVLRLDLTAAPSKPDVYRAFMLGVGNEFRGLTACYMAELLNLFIPGEKRPEFVICGVGTRADQDDLDVGIIDDGSRHRQDFNRAIGKIASQMMRHATSLHLYLSEHVGTESYSASISEYNDLLDKEIHDFVIITEMLGASRILGSPDLFDAFRHEITQRYYFSRAGDNKYHEGYLRGILGETRSFVIRQMKSDSLNPKDDGLRMIKGLIYAGKTIFGIEEVNSWAILDELSRRDPEWRETYERLDEALAFLEIFRYLYQLFMVQEEEIFLQDESIPQSMDLIARTMGYQDMGAIRPWDHLLIHYHEHVQSAKEMAEALLPHYSEHLKSISMFSQLRDWRLKGDYQGNLAIDLVEMSGFFRGTKFWDDILQDFEEEDGELLAVFAQDLNSLEPEVRERVIRRYAEWTSHSFIAVISLLVVLAKNRRRLKGESLVEQLTAAFFEAREGTPDEIRRLTKIFHHYPRLIDNLLAQLDEDRQREFCCLLDAEIWEEEIARMRGRLKRLCELHIGGSKYFKRFFHRVVARFPEYILYLDDEDKLREIAKGMFGEVEQLPTFKKRKQRLGDYHDLEFLRVGLATLRGASFVEINTEFTEFSDNYMQTLFDICKQEVDGEIGEKVVTQDLLAIFAAGGHAREQAYDDDYDLMVLLDSNDQRMMEYSNRIVTRMNTELIKRGTLPHYRFAERFGNYVTLIRELDELFAEDGEDVFVDKSQVLCARMLVGSATFERNLMEKIIEPHIFRKNEDYIREMRAEMGARHEDERRQGGSELDVKEGVGGLRDIEMVLLIYKARLKLREPISRRLFALLAEVDGRHREEFLELGEACEFLKNLRDIYRLTVAAEDTLSPAMLGEVAAIMGFTAARGKTPTENLLEAYRARTKQVDDIVTRLLAAAEFSRS